MIYKGSRCCNQDRNIGKIYYHHSKRAPKAVEIASTDTLTKENTVMIVFFDTDATVTAVISVFFCDDFAVSTPL